VLALYRVLATSRTPYFEQAAALGAEFFEDADDFCEEHPDVVILATSILSTEPVLRNLPLTRLKRSTLFAVFVCCGHEGLLIQQLTLWLPAVRCSLPCAKEQPLPREQLSNACWA
jgi:hypothetical protein